MKNFFQQIILIIIVALVASYFGAAMAVTRVAPTQNAQNNVTPSTTASGSVTNTQEQQVIDVVKNASPAVVSITISQNVPVTQNNQQIPGFPSDPFSSNSPFSINVPQSQQQGTQQLDVGGGSGFIVSPNGIIVTNKHVVSQPGAEYTVVTNSGEKYKATVLARDPVNDIAIIKIDAKNLPYLQFANSDNIQVGQTVIVIGNALGEFKNSVSTGVISGLSRSIVAGDLLGQSEQLNQVLQTDAAINLGNSGGPMLDLSGQVVGVTSAMAQNGENIGFAIPSNVAKPAVESVQKTGKIIRPYLGVRYVQITPSVKDANKLSVDYGAFVTHGQTPSELAVVTGSPADKAGIKDGDIILEIDGKKLDSNTNLSNIVQQKQIGDTVTLKVLHQSKEKTVQIKLVEMPQ